MGRMTYNTNRINSPCKGCPDRTIELVNCHSHCEKYLKSIEDWEQYKKKVDDSRKADYDYQNFKRTNVENTKKYMNNHKPRNH